MVEETVKDYQSCLPVDMCTLCTLWDAQAVPDGVGDAAGVVTTAEEEVEEKYERKEETVDEEDTEEGD
ncbi:hypothetical protein E2C01_073933 [Portunus trituberculatus]|uniref:Uncharacterized protein n=1 Tax=Portunus trituberculatus TaxID=210409 RepID=A0A5B7ID02_PORTR|nr:hypothetical protein [Portunus trituberculatus]